MNTKKYLIGAGLTVTILGGVVSLALAEDMMMKKTSEASSHPKPMVVQIGPNGNALLRGNIKTVGTDFLTVTSWGGDWMVNVSSSDARIIIIPKVDIAQFKAGDFVGVQGSVNKNASFTIDATIVRNWTERKEMQAAKQEIKQMIKAQNTRNWQGTASNVNVSARSLTLTINGTAYTVNIAVDAKIVNKKYLTIPLSDIKDGHTVRVWGPSSDTTITASLVRDVSIEPVQ